MKIQIVEKNDTEIKFVIQEITDAFANELRRIMMSEVPTMAIEWVDFKQIPLTFDQKAYELPEECKCEGKGCSRCQVEMVLKKKGPGMIYSGDLKTKAKDVKPVFDNIPIVELFEGEELQFEAIAQLGKGKTHAKWQGVVVGYKQDKDVFTFTVESVCGLPTEDVISTAAEVFENKISDFNKSLGKLK